MKDKLLQYIEEHKTFTIPELQAKLVMPYKYIREYITRLEEDGDVKLQPNGLEYSFEFLEYDDWDLYEEEEEPQEDPKEDEEEEAEEVKLWEKDSSFLEMLEQRRRELNQRKEELERKKLEDCVASIIKPPKEYVWILWYCIKEDEIKISSIKKFFSFPQRQILKALNWMKDHGYINKAHPNKVEFSKDLFLSLYGDYEFYNPQQHENILYKIAYYCIKNKCVNVNAIQIEFDLGFAKTNELLEELEQKEILSSMNEKVDRKILVDEDTLFEIFYAQ